jgi:aspartyl-tRNA(Asn)/glutamyl-tRNA(Gln) amidotransferase subunit A
MRPTDYTLRGALDALAAGETTSVALTEAHLEAIGRLNPRLNAFITVAGEKALEAAKASDARRAAGKAGPLEGAPLAIKDLFCTAGTQTTAGSAILRGFVPPYESTVSGNLLRDGAVFLGKVNLDEFAMGSSAPSASPRRSAGLPGSSRPMAAVRASGSWRLRVRSTRRGRWRAPSRIAPFF